MLNNPQVQYVQRHNFMLNLRESTMVTGALAKTGGGSSRITKSSKKDTLITKISSSSVMTSDKILMFTQLRNVSSTNCTGTLLIPT